MSGYWITAPWQPSYFSQSRVVSQPLALAWSKSTVPGMGMIRANWAVVVPSLKAKSVVALMVWGFSPGRPKM